MPVSWVFFVHVASKSRSKRINHSQITHRFLSVRWLHALPYPCINLSLKHFKKLLFLVWLALCLEFLFSFGKIRTGKVSYAVIFESFPVSPYLPPSFSLPPSLPHCLPRLVPLQMEINLEPEPHPFSWLFVIKEMDGSSQCQADAATITPGLVIDRGRERGRVGGSEGGDGEGETARGASITPLNLPVTLGAWQGKKKEGWE